jgi:glucose-6-phosphate 1-dehydrogenase
METSNPNREVEMEVFASVSTPDLGIDSGECLTPQLSQPCIIVIMGATGDLTVRKLIPALFNLYLNGGLPESFIIVGCGRTELDSFEFRKKMETALEATDTLDRTRWQAFAAALHYQIIDYENPESYAGLAES